MATVSLKCDCGKVQGTAHDISASDGTRVVCCCDNCQAFATHLSAEARTLDQFGGTDIFQVTQAQVTIEKGLEHLQCLRLTKKGLLRWYTGCCNTPVANTIKAGMPFAGIIHTFIDLEHKDEVLGPVRAHVQTQHATSKPNYVNSSEKFPLAITGRIIRKIMIGKIKGKGTPSVFFGDDGRPVAKPFIVNAE